MKIYEVAFKDTESSRARKKRYFSNRTDQNGFITSHIGSLFSFEKKDYNIGFSYLNAVYKILFS